jgi:hypothetical protein
MIKFTSMKNQIESPISSRERICLPKGRSFLGRFGEFIFRIRERLEELMDGLPHADGGPIRPESVNRRKKKSSPIDQDVRRN